jgi:hypothetical protein
MMVEISRDTLEEAASAAQSHPARSGGTEDLPLQVQLHQSTDNSKKRKA